MDQLVEKVIVDSMVLAASQALVGFPV